MANSRQNLSESILHYWVRKIRMMDTTGNGNLKSWKEGEEQLRTPVGITVGSVDYDRTFSTAESQ